ncbi:hypothetical protein QBC47DRAFT_331102 [Echria macrotheca]|uniref:Nephrocystin 3-like N-terminal domain-containing protein n=1 Tax=Echria macrotheca TaxID=438768 RepID=A0AAJ0F7A6_9PEZI|nr:hypothetical protein QBC47DRAFT_331102 [Echria macrotheca]
MLGLGKGLLKKRSSGSSVSTMETIRAGLQESAHGLTMKKVQKPSDAVSISTSVVSNSTSSSHSEKTISVIEESHVSSTTTTTIHITRVSEITKTIRGHICQLGDYNDSFFKKLNLSSYLEYISDERLIHMPRRGSDWDRVLRAAQFFGFQLWAFGAGVGRFCPGTEEASITALGSAQILLEIGHQQAKALMPTFQALYELSLMIMHVSQIPEIFHAPREVKEDVANLYCDVIDLVGNISFFYRKEMNKLAPGKKSTTTFEAAFGRDLSDVWRRHDTLTSRMWMAKLGHRHTSFTVDWVRRRLKHDRSTKGSFYDQVSESMKRAEDTCEWLKEPVAKFLRNPDTKDKTLTITGETGSGKTVLAGWIKERLQRPLERVQYSTLLYTFPDDSKSQCTTLAFLKGVLYQLLEKNVGDVALYEKLVSAYEAFDKHHSESKLEESLWAALETGLRTINDRHANLVIIVDGFHQLGVVGNRDPLGFHKQLRACVSKFKTIRVITLSKSISYLSEGCDHFNITPYHLQADIQAFFSQSFERLPYYSQIVDETEVVVDELTKKAKASFIWAYFVVSILAKEKTANGFLKTARAISTNMSETLEKLVSILSLKNETTQTMLSFMLAANRPLLVAELEQLLRVNVAARRFGDTVDIVKHIKSTCREIIVVEGGSVHFKSKAVRDYMEGLMGKSLPSPRDAHRHLTLALLLYAKLVLPETAEPSLDLLTDKAVDEAFSSNGLLYYAVKHWQSHFQASSFYEKGSLKLTKDFQEVFPSSCYFALLERSSCSYGVSTSHLIEQYKFSLKVRETCFGEKHVTVVQNLIFLGKIHVASEPLVGARFFYRAASLGRAVLSTSSAVVMSCTHYFLELTATITITTRTEIVTYREEMIILMIEICETIHGKSSGVVMRWYEVLAKLYVAIKETTKAAHIYQILLKLYIGCYGDKSIEVERLRGHVGDLEIVLDGEMDVVKIDEYACFLLETTEELDITDERRITVLLRLAAMYASQKQWFLAEKIYITLWRRISEICRLKASIEMHILKINIALAYIRFLKGRGMKEEASNILICLWVEYEHHEFEEKTIIVLIKDIGVLFKAFGLLQIAISVFTKVWGWFKGKGSVTDDEALETTVLITEVVEEITTTTVDRKTTTITVTEVTETVVKEIFETHFTRCRKSKFDVTFFDSCLALVNLYIKTQNWAQAEVVIRRSLEVTWKAILTAEVNIKLSEHFVSECIKVAMRLAVCYRKQRCFEKAESIYLRIYYACLASLKISDVRIGEALTVLIEFYEEHHRHEKVIEIYVQLLARYRKELGSSHKLTIDLLYLLASHCRLLGRADAYEYYIEIVTILNANRKHCHHDAFKAAIILVEYYHEEKRWMELQHVCSVLWETFLHHHKECVFTEEVIQLIYEKYVHVLEFHAKVSISVLYEISVKYRETVTVVFGQSASILILAMIALAGICARYEGHHHESVTIYEEVITRTKKTETRTITITEETITTVKTRLAKVYVTIITSGGSTTTTTIERAIELCLEAYAQLTITFGCWHEKTLLKLKDIIVLYRKLNTKEAHVKIFELLQVSFVSIVKSNCGSMSLYHAAATLASIYIAAGLAKEGLKLVRYLRHLTIFGQDFAITTDVVLKLDVAIGRAAFVFLVSFEQHLVEKITMTYSELMAVTLLEITLYKEYKRVIETETRIEVILEYGAKLRSFWIEQKQEHMIVVLDKKLFQMFKAKYSAFIKTNDEYTHIFYTALLSILGVDNRNVDFAAFVCRAGNAKVAALLKAKEFKKALEVAKCTFHFAHGQHFYDDLHRVNYAYKLAEFMAGIDVEKPSDSKLWEEYLDFSRKITAEALAIFKASKVDFVRLNYKDLSGIVRLLGSQQNFAELEILLTKLWKSREVQKNWNPARVVSVGRLMVHAYVAAKKLKDAIGLCDTMCYNLRRSRGVLDHVTIEMTQMLAELYTYDKRVDKAMAVHEQLLREIEAALREDDGWQAKARESVCYYPVNGASGSPPKQILIAQPKPEEELAKTAGWTLELLKRSYLRLGKWTKAEAEYTTLHASLQSKLARAGLQVSPPETWAKAAAANKDKPDDMIGKYVGLREWEWELEGDDVHVKNGTNGHANGNGAVVKSRWSRNVDHVLVASQEWLVV